MSNLDIRNSFVKKHALVTGGLGFIGSNLVRRLVNWGANVTVVDNNIPETGANFFNIEDIRHKVNVLITDIRNGTTVRPLLAGKDFLFNLAGLSSHFGGMQNPIEDLEVNALAQLQILEYCREMNKEIRIVFAGTRQIYGITNRLPVNEDTRPFPVDYNGVSKLAGELYHIICSRIYNLWATSIRMTNTYGPRMRVKDGHQTFIGLWIRLVLEGKKLPIFGTGEQMRDFNYVEDVIDALLLSVTNPIAQGKFYNLGGEAMNLIDTANLLISLNGSGSSTLVPFPEERLKIDIKDYAGDYSRIKSELGWQPTINLKEGLARTLAFYRLYKNHYWQE